MFISAFSHRQIGIGLHLESLARLLFQSEGSPSGKWFEHQHALSITTRLVNVGSSVSLCRVLPLTTYDWVQSGGDNLSSMDWR